MASILGLSVFGSMVAVAQPKYDTFTQGAKQVDPYTDGARTIAKLDKFDPYTDGAKTRDIYTDGAKA